MSVDPEFDLFRAAISKEVEPEPEDEDAFGRFRAAISRKEEPESEGDFDLFRAAIAGKEVAPVAEEPVPATTMLGPPPELEDPSPKPYQLTRPDPAEELKYRRTMMKPTGFAHEGEFITPEVVRERTVKDAQDAIKLGIAPPTMIAKTVDMAKTFAEANIYFEPGGELLQELNEGGVIDYGRALSSYAKEASSVLDAASRRPIELGEYSKESKLIMRSRGETPMKYVMLRDGSVVPDYRDESTRESLTQMMREKSNAALLSDNLQEFARLNVSMPDLSVRLEDLPAWKEAKVGDLVPTLVAVGDGMEVELRPKPAPSIEEELSLAIAARRSKITKKQHRDLVTSTNKHSKQFFPVWKDQQFKAAEAFMARNRGVQEAELEWNATGRQVAAGDFFREPGRDITIHGYDFPDPQGAIRSQSLLWMFSQQGIALGKDIISAPWGLLAGFAAPVFGRDGLMPMDPDPNDTYWQFWSSGTRAIGRLGYTLLGELPQHAIEKGAARIRSQAEQMTLDMVRGRKELEEHIGRSYMDTAPELIAVLSTLMATGTIARPGQVARPKKQWWEQPVIQPNPAFPMWSRADTAVSVYKQWNKWSLGKTVSSTLKEIEAVPSVAVHLSRATGQALDLWQRPDVSVEEKLSLTGDTLIAMGDHMGSRYKQYVTEPAEVFNQGMFKVFLDVWLVSDAVTMPARMIAARATNTARMIATAERVGQRDAILSAEAEVRAARTAVREADDARVLLEADPFSWMKLPGEASAAAGAQARRMNELVKYYAERLGLKKDQPFKSAEAVTPEMRAAREQWKKGWDSVYKKAWEDTANPLRLKLDAARARLKEAYSSVPKGRSGFVREVPLTAKAYKNRGKAFEGRTDLIPAEYSGEAINRGARTLTKEHAYLSPLGKDLAKEITTRYEAALQGLEASAEILRGHYNTILKVIPTKLRPAQTRILRYADEVEAGVWAKSIPERGGYQIVDPQLKIAWKTARKKRREAINNKDTAAIKKHEDALRGIRKRQNEIDELMVPKLDEQVANLKKLLFGTKATTTGTETTGLVPAKEGMIATHAKDIVAAKAARSAAGKSSWFIERSKKLVPKEWGLPDKALEALRTASQMNDFIQHVQAATQYTIPVVGQLALVNRAVHMWLDGPGSVGIPMFGRFDKADLRRLWYDRDNRVPVFYQAITREGDGAAGAWAYELANHLRTIPDEVMLESRAFMKFEHDYVTRHFDLNPYAPAGKKYSIKPDLNVSATEMYVLENRLNVANIHADGIVSYLLEVSDLGKSARVFHSPHKLRELYYPEQYRKIFETMESRMAHFKDFIGNPHYERAAEELAVMDKALNDRAIGMAIMENTMRRKGVSVAEREAGFLIERVAKDGTKYHERVRLSTEIADELLGKLPIAVKEFRMIKAYNEMRSMPSIHKPFPSANKSAALREQMHTTMNSAKLSVQQIDEAVRPIRAEIARLDALTAEALDVAQASRKVGVIKNEIEALVLKGKKPKTSLRKRLDDAELQLEDAFTRKDLRGNKWIEVGPHVKANTPGGRFRVEGNRLTGIRNRPAGSGAFEMGEFSGMLNPDIAYELYGMEMLMKEYGSASGKLLNFMKMTKTILSVGTHVTNWLGNFLFLAPMAGLSPWNPLNWEYLAKAGADFASMSKSSQFIRWVKSGGRGPTGGINSAEMVTGAHRGVGLLYQGIFGNAKRAHKNLGGFLRETMNGNIEGALKYGGGAWKHAKVFPKNAYQIGDDLWRYALFLKKIDERGAWKFADSLIDSQSALLGRKAFADYENLNGLFQHVRTKWWGQVFVAFDARTTPHMLSVMKNNPARGNMMIALHEYMSTQNQIDAGFDPEMANKALQAIPDWEKNWTWMHGIFPELANTKYAGLRMDLMKYAPLARRAMHPGESFLEWLGRAVMPDNPFLGTGLALVNVHPFRRKPIYKTGVGGDSPEGQVEKFLDAILNIWLPPDTGPLRLGYWAQVSDFVDRGGIPYGETRPRDSFEHNVARWMGIRMKNWDPQKIEEVGGASLKSDIKKLTDRRMSLFLQYMRKNISKDTFDREMAHLNNEIRDFKMDQQNRSELLDYFKEQLALGNSLDTVSPEEVSPEEVSPEEVSPEEVNPEEVR